jgi:hypothetical protein
VLQEPGWPFPLALDALLFPPPLAARPQGGAERAPGGADGSHPLAGQAPGLVGVAGLLQGVRQDAEDLGVEGPLGRTLLVCRSGQAEDFRCQDRVVVCPSWLGRVPPLVAASLGLVQPPYPEGVSGRSEPPRQRAGGLSLGLQLVAGLDNDGPPG